MQFKKIIIIQYQCQKKNHKKGLQFSFFDAVSEGVCLFLIDSSRQAELWQGN